MQGIEKERVVAFINHCGYEAAEYQEGEVQEQKNPVLAKELFQGFLTVLWYKYNMIFL